jgi:2-aminoadipate transaminase
MAANISSGAAGGLALTQHDQLVGQLDLGPGYLHPPLLATALVGSCVGEAVARWGGAALAYGANAGPGPLREHLAARIAAAGTPTGAQNVLTTAGTSDALDQLAIVLASQGRAVLTESRTYNLGGEIFAARGVRTIAVPGPDDDLDLEQFRRLLSQAGPAHPVPAIYVIPTFHNPTGRVLGLARRRELMALAHEFAAPVIEDLAYADLAFAGPPPPTLRDCAPDPDQVISLFSTAKTLGPGLRCGWLVAAEQVVADLAGDAARVSGGGRTHLGALAVTVACLEGGLDHQVAWLRGELRLRRDVLLTGLLERLPAGYRLDRPEGGYFAWLRLPVAVAEQTLLHAAQARGVSFAPGSRFGPGPGAIRLCYAAAGPQELAEAADVLVAAAQAVS